ncbi:MAG: SPOR domain-containing protein [Pseudomonadota bacterium]
MAAGAQKSKALASLILGMVIGLSIAGVVAWYMVQKNPASFNRPSVAHEQPKPAPQVVTPQPAPQPEQAAAPAQQQFEFYRVLPDKNDTAARPAPTPAPKVAAAKAADSTPYLIQVAAFQSMGDAEKLKARLALAGFEASIQSVAIPDKGIWHRVRLGPYKGQGEANGALDNLKANGITTAAVMRAQ